MKLVFPLALAPIMTVSGRNTPFGPALQRC